jgi:SSS family solute:Na+ symporter
MFIKITVTVIYLAIVAWLGMLGYKQTKDSADYLVAGRQIHPFIMALSYGATFISTSAIVGFGGLAGVFGMGLVWLTFFNIFLGVFIAFIFFGKRTRKMGHNMNAHTFPEFLALRFESKFLQKFIGLVIFIFMPIYTAAVMIGASKFIENSLNFDYHIALFIFSAIVASYVFFGGLKGVMYSDAFQGSLMFVGMAVLLIATYMNLGGVGAANAKLTAMFSNPEVLSQIEGTMANGFAGWTSMPTFLSTYWYVLVTSIIMGVGIGVLAQPQLAVRYMSVKSDRELNRAIPIGGIFIAMMTGVAFTVGALSNVYFFEKTGKIAVAYAKGTDNIIPIFIQESMPEWFVTVFLIIIIAAGMSTISSQFHTIGSSVGRDLFKTKDHDPKREMFITKAGMLIGVLVTIFLAYTLPNVWEGAIAISTAIFFGLCAASFLPMYVGALYVKKMPKKAAIGGMMSGFVVYMFWICFVHAKEAVVIGLCQALFGVPVLFNNSLAVLDPMIPGLLVSSIVTFILIKTLPSDVSDENIAMVFEGVGLKEV